MVVVFHMRVTAFRPLARHLSRRAIVLSVYLHCSVPQYHHRQPLCCALGVVACCSAASRSAHLPHAFLWTLDLCFILCVCCV